MINKIPELLKQKLCITGTIMRLQLSFQVTVFQPFARPVMRLVGMGRRQTAISCPCEASVQTAPLKLCDCPEVPGDPELCDSHFC